MSRRTNITCIIGVIFLSFVCINVVNADEILKYKTFGDISFDTMPPTFTAEVNGRVYVLAIDEKSIDSIDQDDFIEEKNVSIEFAELDAKGKLASFLKGGSIKRKTISDRESVIKKRYSEKKLEEKNKIVHVTRRKSSESSLDANLPSGVRILYTKVAPDKKSVLVVVGVPK